YLLMNPAAGIVTLTILLAALFLVEGAVQLSFAFEMRAQQSWIWMLFSRLVSIAVGLIIAAGLPGISLFALRLAAATNCVRSVIALILLPQSLPDAKARWRPAASSA